MKKHVSIILVLLVIFSSLFTSCNEEELDPNICKITVKSEGNGAVSITDYIGTSVNVLIGNRVEVEATPDEGWAFIGWYVSGTESPVSTDAVFTFITSESVTLTARFAKLSDIIIRSGGNGSVAFKDAAGNSMPVVLGTEVTVIATPDNDCDFIGWFVGDSETPISTEKVYTFIATENIILTGQFCKLSTIKIRCIGNGHVSFKDYEGTSITVLPNTEVTVIATFNEYSDFIGWFEDNSDTPISTETEYTFKVNKNTTLTAKFHDYEALLWAMPAFLNDAETVAGNHYEWGYGSQMHIRDVMTGDMTVVATGYDWYSSWGANKNQGENSANTQYVWNYYYQFIQTSNNLIAAVDSASATPAQLGMLGAAQAYRALAYLDLAQMYEFLPNDVIESVNAAGNDVLNLTVPIVREGMTEDEVRNNPRATREQMAAFILSDLDKAEENIKTLEITSKTIPHLDVVYGLKARYYMWLGDYENAKTYARLSIDNNTGHVMSQDECLNTVSGFNTTSPWMWASTTQKEDAVVKTGILNWASWMSPEAQYGYNAAGATSMIDAAMYARISDTDFRKLMFKAPAGHALEAKVPYIDAAWGAELPEYAAIKFRPNEGNTQEYSVGSSTSYPLMRVEEMYFIEAEAAEHVAPGEGIALLTDFMTTYRDAAYAVPFGVDAIDEIVFQKRVELWGEGQSFYDYKRLNMSVTRGYEGSNVDAARQFNTNGRPAWMNFCIAETEKKNNAAIIDWENPDPSNTYDTWATQ